MLISAEDLPRLQHICGVLPAVTAPAAWGRAGARAGEFQALRDHLSTKTDLEPLSGELAAAAFLRLLDPADPRNVVRLRMIEQALRQPIWVGKRPFELLLALDWSWDSLAPAAREDFLLAVRKRAKPLTPADSPLDHRVFSDKLVALAAAVAIGEGADSGTAWREQRKQLLAAARTYFEQTFPTFLRWRGLSPTSPAAGPEEELDIVLALELAGHVMGRDVWSEHREAVARCLEHYVFASFAHPALQQHFARDDGQLAPLSPAVRWEDLLPLTAHLLAVRTRDAAAAFIARRVEQRLRGPTAEPLAVPWLWVPIIFDTRGIPCADFANLPVARNFGGAVAFRGRVGASETGVWIEAGQPFLRRRQHFDAGHFLIYGGGQLTVSGGDDIALEAVPAKRGSQHLGDDPQPFDFEQYFASTIAHNCLLLWEPGRVPRWAGKRYEPAGGQRLLDTTCTDFAAPLDAQQRQTARQLAYGHEGFQAYLALDLLPAYEPRCAGAYTREFVFLAGRVLLVIDRVTPARRVAPAWVVNVPARPEVDGRDLSVESRRAGPDNSAGIWQADAARWLRWTSGDGCLWLFPLEPDPRRVFVIGGPATKEVVPGGPHAGRTYQGSSAAGFERLVGPAGRDRPRNAWYRLGEPTVLGPLVGTTPHWGRIEIEPPQPGQAAVFINLLVVGASDSSAPPAASLTTTEDGGYGVGVSVDALRFLVRLPRGREWGGEVEWGSPSRASWKLPRAVSADAPLVTE